MAKSCLYPGLNPGGRAPIPPPPGVVPNFENPYSRRTELLIANVVCLCLAGIFVAMRIYTKSFLSRKMAHDDVATVIAFVLSIGFSAATMIANRYGWGVHCWELEVTTVPNYMKMEVALISIYSLLIFFVKAAILLLYIRIFDSSRFVKYSVWLLFFPLLVYSIVSFFLSIFPCRPVHALWTPSVRGKCLDATVLGAVSAIMAISTDVAIFVLPLRSIWRMRLPARQRIQVIAVLATGLVACGVSVVRVITFVELTRQFDVTWYTHPPMVWTVAEVNVGIICGCMPTLKPLLRRHFPNFFATVTAQPTRFINSPSSQFSKSSKQPYMFTEDIDDGPLTRPTDAPPREDNIELALNTHGLIPAEPEHVAMPDQPPRPSYPFAMI